MQEHKNKLIKFNLLAVIVIALTLSVVLAGTFLLLINKTNDGENASYLGTTTITFELDGGTLLEADKSLVTTLQNGEVIKIIKNSSTFGELPRVEMNGYDFLGWFTARDSVGTKIEQTTDLIKRPTIVLYAKYKPTTYICEVVYKDIDTNASIATKQVREVLTGTTFTAQQKQILGYTFLEDESELTKVVTNATTLSLYYKRNTYTIHYAIDTEQGLYVSEYVTNIHFKQSGYVNLKPISELTICDSNFNKIGYGFKQWELGSIKLFDNTRINPTDDDFSKLGFIVAGKEIKKDITLVAKYEQLNYNAEFYEDTELKKSQVRKYNETVDNYAEFQPKAGRKFVGWYLSPTGVDCLDIVGKVAVDFETFKMPANDVKFYVGYELLEYDLIVNNFGGTLLGAVPSKITIKTNITLPQISKNGYQFLGWRESGTTNAPNLNFVIKDKNCNFNVDAVFSPIQYPINLQLCGGALASFDNATYTIESDDFVLPLPSKVGYEFIGYTGEGVDVPSTVITIEKGSFGEKYYTANYEILHYDIEYIMELDTASMPSNPATYTYEDTFTLNNPTADGYNFVGWSVAEASPVKPLTINAHTCTGALVFTAHFKAITYYVSLNANGGSLQLQGEAISSGSKVKSFTIKTETFTINATSNKKGYNFEGWQIDEQTNMLITVEKGTCQNLTFNAVFSTVSYVVDYDLQGGETIEGQVYPNSYDVTTPSFTPPSVEKTGYTFNGWKLYNELNQLLSGQRITKGSTGNRIFVAEWLPSTNTQYVVRHNYEKVDEGYDIEDETKYGTTDETIRPIAKNKFGFMADIVEEKVVNANGNTIINIYYNRLSYNLSIIGDVEQIEDMCFKYGETININFIMKDGFTFANWQTEYTDENGSPKSETSNLSHIETTMPHSDMTIRVNGTNVVNS